VKRWVGPAITFAVTILILTTDPNWLFGSDSVAIKAGFVIALLWSACVIFIIRHLDMSNASISRHLVLWSTGFVAVAIGTVNIDYFTDTPRQQTTTVSVVKPDRARTITKKPRKNRSNETSIADTPKFDRIERLVEEKTNWFSVSNRPEIKNIITEKNTRLPHNWKISEKQKRQFKRFLAKQGQKYDPETAFSLPVARGKNDPFGNRIAAQ